MAYPQTVGPGAAVLSNWPENLRDLLRRTGSESSKEGASEHQFTKRHERFRSALFKRGIPAAEIGFIREVFVEYALTEWSESIVRFRKDGLPNTAFDKKLLNRKEIAEYLGVSVRTVSQLHAEGNPAIKRLITGARSVICADKSELGFPQARPGKSFGERDACMMLGLPVAVIRELRRCGAMKIRNMATPRSAFHEADLDDFSQELISKALEGVASPISDIASREDKSKIAAITLTQAYRGIKCLSAEGSASLVLALLNGEIKALGKTGDSPGQLIMDRRDIRRLVFNSRSEVLGTPPSTAEAASALRCEMKTVRTLVKTGLLDISGINSHFRVTGDSLDRFREKYVSLASLAKEYGSSSKRILKLFDQAGMETLRIERSVSGIPQHLLPRALEKAGRDLLRARDRS